MILYEVLVSSSSKTRKVAVLLANVFKLSIEDRENAMNTI